MTVFLEGEGHWIQLSYVQMCRRRCFSNIFPPSADTFCETFGSRVSSLVTLRVNEESVFNFISPVPSPTSSYPNFRELDLLCLETLFTQATHASSTSFRANFTCQIVHIEAVPEDPIKSSPFCRAFGRFLAYVNQGDSSVEGASNGELPFPQYPHHGQQTVCVEFGDETHQSILRSCYPKHSQLVLRDVQIEKRDHSWHIVADRFTDIVLPSKGSSDAAALMKDRTRFSPVVETDPMTRQPVCMLSTSL